MGWLVGRGGENEQSERFAAIEKRLDDQDKAIERVEHSWKLLKIEWESVLDKMGKIMGRLNARIRKSEGLTAPENDAEVVTLAPAPPQILGSHAQLSAHRSKRGLLPR